MVDRLSLPSDLFDRHNVFSSAMISSEISDVFGNSSTVEIECDVLSHSMAGREDIDVLQEPG